MMAHGQSAWRAGVGRGAILVLALAVLGAALDAPSRGQPPKSGSTGREQEDPKAKGKVKPPPSLDDEPPAKSAAKTPDSKAPAAKTPPKAEPKSEPKAEPKSGPAVPPPGVLPAAVEQGPPEGPGVVPPPGVLVVGVRSLPEWMSPSRARSEAETFALDLLFEGLVRPAHDADTGLTYEPALARDLPRLVSRGREFDLIDAVWADPSKPEASEPVTAVDIRTTLEKMHNRRGQPRTEAGEGIETVYSDSARRCRLVFTRGQIDPLALLSFKLLPHFTQDDESFARKPIGSGPFTYAGRKVQGGRTYALFPANPLYGKRAGRAGLPRLQAVWMVASRNPVADFRGKLVHLVLTSQTSDLSALQPPPASNPGSELPPGAGRLEVFLGNAGRVDSVPGRRIHFLALNHAIPSLRGPENASLRRILAHAIARESILNDCFRAGFAQNHQALHGPFPPGSWPCNPLVGRLDDPDLARALAAQRPNASPITLELKFPAGDPVTARACQLIKDQLDAQKLGLQLALKPEEPAEFRRRVYDHNDFQLALCHHDYPDDWFNPLGLLDPQAIGPGLRNFQAFRPTAEFEAVLARCANRREFTEHRKAMQQLHALFLQDMPFIPLWQLDTHVLQASGLTIVPAIPALDPQAPFRRIEDWSLR